MFLVVVVGVVGVVVGGVVVVLFVGVAVVRVVVVGVVVVVRVGGVVVGVVLVGVDTSFLPEHRDVFSLARAGRIGWALIRPYRRNLARRLSELRGGGAILAPAGQFRR